MRIIAGRWRGRPLVPPPGRETRPILDRVKVSLFDRLGARLAMPGRLPPVSVLDLFAGTGALGLECLSRGASSCMFVENDGRAFAALRRNLNSLGIVGEAEAVRGDAFSISLRRCATGQPYSLVFVDPPYRLSRRAARIRALCQRLAASTHLDRTALLILRHESRSDFSDLSEVGLERDERLGYGKMAISIFRQADD